MIWAIKGKNTGWSIHNSVKWSFYGCFWKLFCYRRLYGHQCLLENILNSYSRERLPSGWISFVSFFVLMARCRDAMFLFACFLYKMVTCCVWILTIWTVSKLYLGKEKLYIAINIIVIRNTQIMPVCNRWSLHCGCRVGRVLHVLQGCSTLIINSVLYVLATV